jgi:tRNA-Thr(GGU) m(6)t(6)A37 methyltransferase TsaA
MEPICFSPIGYVEGGRTAPEKDNWASNRSRLVLDASRFGPEALAGLSDFSHLMVLFYFHAEADEPVELGSRRPRGRVDWPEVGIFAQRGRMRPNRIGVSIAAIEQIDGLVVSVSGLDAIHGTPILDLKPVISGYAPRGSFKQPDWAGELMKHYW